MSRLIQYILALMLLSFNGIAAVWTGVTGSQTEMQGLINGASSGDTVIYPIATNHYTTGLTWSGKNIKLLTATGAGLITATYGGGVTNSYAIQNSYVTRGNACAIYWDATSGNLIACGGVVDGYTNEIRGFTIFQTNTPNDNTISLIRMSGNCFLTRVDSNCFYQTKQKCVETEGWCYGVVDHNAFLKLGGISVDFNHPLYGTNTWGDGSWIDPDFPGTTNMMYAEFNISTNSHATADGFIDEDNGGGRIGLRYNTATNDNITFHGTDGTRPRGVRWYEIYGNFFVIDPNNLVQPVWVRFIYPRGGSGVIFNNYAIGYQLLCDFSIYRSFLGTWNSPGLWGGASGTNTWDSNNGSLIDSGTHSGGNLSTILTDSTKNWTVNQFKNGKYVLQNRSQSGSIAIYGTVISNDAHNITFMGNVASSGISTNMLFNTGESYALYQIVGTLDQVGYGQGDLLLGGDNPPSLPAVTNAILGGKTWPRQVADPVYLWNNTNYMTPSQQAWVGGSAYTYATAQHPTLVSNVDWKQDTVRPSYIALGVHPLDPAGNAPPPLPPARRLTVQGTLKLSGKMTISQ